MTDAKAALFISRAGADADFAAVIGEIHRRQERYREAEPLIVRSLALSAKALGPDHELTTAVREDLRNLRSRR